jgi:predicted transcriptional regulator
MDITTDNCLFSEICKALSIPIRVKILQYALVEISQHALVEILQTSESRISQNITVLENIGLIKVLRKEKGKKYVRTIADRFTFQILPITSTQWKDKE